MSSNLVELVFENVPDARLDSLIDALLLESAVEEMFDPEIGPVDSKAGEGVLRFVKDERENAALFIRARLVLVGRVGIERPLLRVLRYNGLNDLELLFDAADAATASPAGVLAELAAGSDVLARAASASDYFCGMEPANDADTQYFHGTRMGPLTTL